MLPVMHRIASDTYVFQQHSAPTHCARETVQLLQQETPQFISPICGLLTVRPLSGVGMQECVYKTLVRDTNNLKQCLID